MYLQLHTGVLRRELSVSVLPGEAVSKGGREESSRPHAGYAMGNALLETLLDRRAEYFAFVQRRVEDRGLAEDILQAAYMRAVEHGPLREGESAAAWFYAVLRNAVVDFYRRRASEGAAIERYGDEFGREEAMAPDVSAPTFVCGCIERVLPLMKPTYAEVLREVDLAEQPLSEFARRHDLTPGNAAVRAHRARAALRAELLRFCGACTVDRCMDCICKVPLPARS